MNNQINVSTAQRIEIAIRVASHQYEDEWITASPHLREARANSYRLHTILTLLRRLDVLGESLEFYGDLHDQAIEDDDNGREREYGRIYSNLSADIAKTERVLNELDY